MAKRKSGPVVVVAVSDLHINSTVALCPAVVRLDDGGEYHASRAQQWLMDQWQMFWAAVETVPCRQRIIVLAGDLIDGNHHQTTQAISYKESEQLALAMAILAPVAKLADALFVIRGTEAHTGPSAMWEEHLSSELDAVRDERAGTSSWWHLPLEAEGVTFDIQHHPRATSRVPWTRDQAAAREAAIVWDEYHELGQRPPDVVIRAHVHLHGKGYSRDTLGVFCPPWQLASAYGYRRGAGRRIEPPGGLLFQCQNGTYTWQALRYWPEMSKPWTLPSPKPS